MSKTNFQHYYTNILIPNKHRITSICLSNLFIVDFICSSPRIILTFIQLERLILNNIQLKYLQNIFNYLISLINGSISSPGNRYIEKNLLPGWSLTPKLYMSASR